MPESKVSYKVLVIDDVSLLSVENLQRRVNQAVKHTEPVFRMDAPWDEKGDWLNYINVLFDEQEGIFKMWYLTLAFGPEQYACTGGRKTGYAISKDGINWERPIMNMVEHNGSTHNNYIIPQMRSHIYSIIEDPSDIPTRKYKMIFSVDSAEMEWANFHMPLCLAYSSDGITWSRPQHVNPVLRGVADSAWGFFYDTDRRKYVLLTRRSPNLPRDLSQYESYDLVNWEDKGRILVPADEHDPPELFNFQAMAPFRYEDFYLGLLNTQYSLPGREYYEVYHKAPAAFDDKRLGSVDVQLAYTRDGQNWVRPTDRSPVIPNGGPGSPDEGTIFVPCSNPIVREGETWIYYHSQPNRHSFWSQTEETQRVGGDARKLGFCMLAKMPEDHWVSLDAGSSEGHLLCEPWGPPHEVFVNADIRANGYLEAELVTPFGQVLEGFGRKDCRAITTSGPRQQIIWGGGHPSRVSKDHVGGVCLRIFLSNAKLYSYTYVLLEVDEAARRLEEDKSNARWLQLIKHRSDNWGRSSTDLAVGPPPLSWKGRRE